MNLELTSLDILYLSLSIGFLVLVISLIFLIMKLVKTLESIKILADDLDETARDVNGVKNKVKGGIFSMLSMMLGIVGSKVRR